MYIGIPIWELWKILENITCDSDLLKNSHRSLESGKERWNGKIGEIPSEPVVLETSVLSKTYWRS